MDFTSIEQLQKIGMMGLLTIAVTALVRVILVLWKKNNALIDNQIESDSRNIKVISGVKNTIDNVKNEIKELKNDVKDVKNKIDK